MKRCKFLSMTSLVMPAPQPDATAGERPLDSQEAAAWLRLLLHGDSKVNPDRKVSSHSLKTTMLSYAARRGLSTWTFVCN